MTTARPHDRLFHAAFSRVEALREFLPRHLDPEVVAILDLARLEVVPGSFLDPQLQEHFADLLVSVGLRGTGEAWVYLLLEHKSRPDPLTPLQLLRYMALIWHQDVQAGQALRPIVPVVVHHGSEPWNVGSLAALVAAPATLERFVPAFQFLVCDLTRVPDHLLLQGESPELRVVAFTLKHVFTDLREHLAVLARELSGAASRPDGEAFVRKVVTYLGEATDTLEPEDLAGVLDAVIPGGSRIMPTIADRYRAEGLAEGIQGQRLMLFETLRLRFASLPAALEARLNALSDGGRIQELHRAALTASTLAEFESQLDR